MLDKLYHTSKEIAIGAGEFAAACVLLGEVIVLWEIAAAAMYGGRIPAWCMVCAAAMIAVPVIMGAAWVVRRMTRRRASERQGVIDAETICRILREEKR